MSYLSGVGYAAMGQRGYAVVKTFPSPWNMLVGKKVATRLRICQDNPSTLEYVSREKSGYAATQLRSRQDLPTPSKYVSKELSSYAATMLHGYEVTA